MKSVSSVTCTGIVPDMLGGERDEFYEMLTALEIKFEDEN